MTEAALVGMFINIGKLIKGCAMDDCHRPISTIYIEGKARLVDTNSFEMLPGDKAAIARHDGSLAIAEVTNYRKEGWSPRAALEPLDEAGNILARCEIIGRVVGTASP